MSNKQLISYFWKGIGLVAVIVVGGYILGMIQMSLAKKAAKDINAGTATTTSGGTTTKEAVPTQSPSGFAAKIR